MLSRPRPRPRTRALASATAFVLAGCTATPPRLPSLDAVPLLDGATTRVDVTTGYDGAAAERRIAGTTVGAEIGPIPTGAPGAPHGIAAGGVTLQGDLGWSSGRWRGFEAQVAYDDLYARAERTGDLSDGATSRLRAPSLVAPSNAWLAWGDRRTRVVAGRQAFAPAGERFVGVVGWRPGEQSYDGFRVQREILPGARLDYTWANGVVAGERADVAATQWRGSFHLLDGTVDAGRLGRVQGFAYRMTFADALRTDAAARHGGAQSGATFGAAWRREFRLGEYAPLPVGMSYASATRQDAAGAPFTTRYLQFETAVPLANTRLKLGRGAVDTYAVVQADVAGTALELGRHDLRASGADGVEWNTTLSRRLAGWLHLQARFAALRGALADDRRWSLQVSAPLR